MTRIRAGRSRLSTKCLAAKRTSLRMSTGTDGPPSSAPSTEQGTQNEEAKRTNGKKEQQEEVTNSHPHDLGELHSRLAALEKQNRRFRQLGAALLVLTASLAVMGQAPSKKIIEANEFILRDDSGKLRARLSLEETQSAATFQLFEPNGTEKVHIDSGASGAGTKMTLSGAAIAFSDVGEFGLLVPDMLLMVKVGEPSRMELGRGRLRLTDAQGFSANFGETELVKPSTGEKHTTSAASVVLFDRNKNVIWKAP